MVSERTLRDEGRDTFGGFLLYVSSKVEKYEVKNFFGILIIILVLLLCRFAYNN